MPNTVSNQKVIIINKPAVIRNFLQIDNNAWMKVNKTLGPYALQLYLYLAANANGYRLALSPEHAEKAAGIKRTSFYKYLKELEENGYIVWNKGNVFQFYTCPLPQSERSNPDSHSDWIFFDDDSPGEQGSLPNSVFPPPDGIEIDNREKIKDNGTQSVPPPAADAACDPYPIGKIIEVRIPNPLPREKHKSKPERRPFSFLDECTDPNTGEFKW